MGQVLLEPPLQCPATLQALPAVAREGLKQLKAATCPGRVLPDVCVVPSVHKGVAPDGE